MASFSEILALIQAIERIIAALSGMGIKINGEVNLAEVLALIPKA